MNKDQVIPFSRADAKKTKEKRKKDITGGDNIDAHKFRESVSVCVFVIRDFNEQPGHAPIFSPSPSRASLLMLLNEIVSIYTHIQLIRCALHPIFELMTDNLQV